LSDQRADARYGSEIFGGYVAGREREIELRLDREHELYHAKRIESDLGERVLYRYRPERAFSCLKLLDQLDQTRVQRAGPVTIHPDLLPAWHQRLERPDGVANLFPFLIDTLFLSAKAALEAIAEYEIVRFGHCYAMGAGVSWMMNSTEQAAVRARSASLRPTIWEQFEEVAKEQDKALPPLSDDLVLADTELDSLCFAIIVARLEDVLGFDPFSLAEEAEFPVTLGEFVAFYELYVDAAD
jgi:hypothetical protein